MRSTNQPLMQRLIDAASTCRPMIEGRVETIADLRQRADQWNACDGGLPANCEVLADGGIRLKATAGGAVGPNVQNSWFRPKEPGNNSVGTAYIDPITYGTFDQFIGLLAQWGGGQANVAYGGIQAWLNPRFSGTLPKTVQTWEVVIYSITVQPSITPTGVQYPYRLAPILTAQADAKLTEAPGYVVFNFKDATGKYTPWHPDPGQYVGLPGKVVGPTYFIVCHGYDKGGNKCQNIAWGMDNTQTSFTQGSGGNTMSLVAAAFGLISTGFSFLEVLFTSPPTPSGLPRLQFIPVSYPLTSTTITFQTGSPIDLGATPSSASLIEFGIKAEVPQGCSVTAQAALDPGASYVTFVDGQSASDIGLAAQRKYDMRVTLNANAGGDRTPTVRALGARVVARTDLSDVAEVVSWSERTDPIVHKSEVEQATIRILHDGERDYRDRVSDLLSQNPPGQFYFRVSIGDRALTKDLWQFQNDFYPDDVQLEDAYVDLICVSCLSQLKQALPVLTSDAVAVPVADSSNPGVWTASTGSLLYTQIADVAEPPWAATTAYLVGQHVTDANSNVQVCTVAGTTGGSVPAWNTSLGGFTIDSGVTWQNQGAVQSGLPDDTTYIQSVSNPSNADYIATLSAIGTPPQSVGAKIQFRAATVGAAQSLTLTVLLREGSTTRATKVVTVNVQDTGQGSYIIFEYLLTATEQVNILNWSNLNLLFRAGGTGQIRVGWARLVVLGSRSPYVSSSVGASVQPIMDDLLANQIALDARFRGPKYLDASPVIPVAKTIEQAATGSTDLNRALDELEALAWIAGGFFAGDEGRLSYRPFYQVATGTDLITGTTTAQYTPLAGPIVAIFPREELEPLSITPGWRQRIPLFGMPYGWNGQNFLGEAQVINQPALTYYRQAMIEAEQRCPTETAKWVSGEGTARGLSARHGQSFGLGLMEWRFRSTYPKPWLQRGDVVVLQTDRFLGYDPIATRAIFGKQWVTAVIIGRWDVMGREWSVWVQSLAAIRPISGALAVPPISATNPLSLGVAGYVGEAAGTSSGDNLNVFWSGTPAVAAVKIATSTSSQPAPGTGTLFVGNSGTALLAGPFAFGTTIYVTITPYATIDGSQAAGVAAKLVKLIDGSSISTPFNNQGSLLPVAADFNLLSYSDNSGPGPTTGWLAWTWAAFSLPQPDGSSLSIPANTTMLSDPPTPSLSQVAGGALGARTYFVKICYRKDNHYIGISAEASLAVSANNLLKVTSPGAIAGMDGWTVLIGTTTGNNFDQAFAGTFGSDFTEPTGGATTSGSTKGSTSWSKAIVDVGLSASTAYWWYPYWDIGQALIRMNFAVTLQVAANAKVAQADGHVPLSASGITVTTPTANNTASGAKGAGRNL